MATHEQVFIAASSWNCAGRSMRCPGREIDTLPLSSGSGQASSDAARLSRGLARAAGEWARPDYK
jgi:hypothetical protein